MATCPGCGGKFPDNVYCSVCDGIGSVEEDAEDRHYGECRGCGVEIDADSVIWADKDGRVGDNESTGYYLWCETCKPKRRVIDTKDGTEWECTYCGEWLTKGAVIWATKAGKRMTEEEVDNDIENGVSLSETGQPWCEICVPDPKD